MTKAIANAILFAVRRKKERSAIRDYT